MLWPKVLFFLFSTTTGIKRKNKIVNHKPTHQVISGLTSTATYRLKKLWSSIDEKFMTQFEEMNSLLSRDNNFSSLRTALHRIQPPALPYLGIYLTDMVFVDQGNPDFLPGTQLINFHKRRLLSYVIREVQQYQQLPYLFEKTAIYPQFKILWTKSEEDRYARSLQIEPREEACKPSYVVSPFSFLLCPFSPPN